MRDIDDVPKPTGELALQTIAMPADTNAHGDIFGGWLMSQMDLAGGITAERRAGCRVATVAVEAMVFLRPVNIGSVVSCYTNIVDIGRSSIRVLVEVWVTNLESQEPQKVTEGQFVFVAIDPSGRTCAVA